MQWYYVEGEKRVGPIGDSEFNELIASNRITSETLVWRKGMTEWQTLGSLSPGSSDDMFASAGELTCSQCLKIFPEEDLIRYEGLLVCAACKPVFFQKVKEGVVVSSAKPSERYGSIEKGLKGEYDFRINDVLKEAWELTKGTKRIILGGTIITYAITLALTFFFDFLAMSFAGQDSMGMMIGIQITKQLVVTLVTLPMWTGIMMIGIRRSVGLPINFSLIFSYYNRITPLFFAYVLLMIFVLIGFILLVIPGIYLSVAYYLTTPLIVEKNFGAWQAMETSRKALSHKWFKVFGLGFSMMLIMMLSAIPLGIGLIWTLPMGMLVCGILYRNVFGVEEPVDE